jgi:hypothetical protein
LAIACTSLKICDELQKRTPRFLPDDSCDLAQLTIVDGVLFHYRYISSRNFWKNGIRSSADPSLPSLMMGVALKLA